MVYISILVSGFMAILICLLFIRIWRKRLEKTLEIEAIIGRLQIEVSTLITELNGTTDRNIALIEHRINALRNTIDRAAKVQNILKTENTKFKKTEHLYTDLSRNRPLNLSVDIPAQEVASKEVDQVNITSIPIRDKVLILYRQGKNTEMIAGELGLDRGEVELIISLYDRNATV